MPKGLPRIVKRVNLNGFGQWRGVSRQGDPSSIGMDQFWNLENARWEGGGIVERGGQTKLNASTLAGGELINGIYDSAYGGTGVGGWGGGGGGGTATGAGSIAAPSGSCPVPQPTTGDGVKFYSLRASGQAGVGAPWTFTQMFYDDEKFPSDSGGGVAEHVFGIPYAQTSDPMYGFFTALENITYNGKIYHFLRMVSGVSTVRVGAMSPCFGDVRTPPSWVFDQTLPGGAALATVGGFTIWNGKLYYTLFAAGSSSGVTPRVYYFDGSQSVEAFNPGLSAIPAEAVVASSVATFAGHVWCGFSNSHIAGNTYYPQQIINELGTSVTIGAVNFGLGKGYAADSGTYTARQSMVEFKGKLYLGGQRDTPEGPAIYSYDSSGTVAVARDLSGVGPTPAGQWTLSGVYTMFVWKGFLWFLYNTRAGSTDAFKLGKFDGTTWTNDVSATGISGYTRMSEYKGAAILYGFSGSTMIRSTDGVTWSNFGTRPGGGNPNSCNVAELVELGTVL